MLRVLKLISVAPYVGAWIETIKKAGERSSGASHPTWVRGLKHTLCTSFYIEVGVAPYVGAWIETILKY